MKRKLFIVQYLIKLTLQIQGGSSRFEANSAIRSELIRYYNFRAI